MLEVSGIVPESFFFLFFEWCFRSTKISFTFAVGFIGEEPLLYTKILYKTFIVQRKFISNSATFHEFSRFIWTLNLHGSTPLIRWSIVKRVGSKTPRIYSKYV